MNTVAPTDQQSGRLHIYRPTGFAQIECIIGPPTHYSSPRHLHEELEIALNPGRTWRQTLRGQRVLIGADALLLTSPGEPHEASSPEVGTAPYLGMRIGQETLDATMADLLERRTTFSPSLSSRLRRDAGRANSPRCVWAISLPPMKVS